MKTEKEERAKRKQRAQSQANIRSITSTIDDKKKLHEDGETSHKPTTRNSAGFPSYPQNPRPNTHQQHIQSAAETSLHLKKSTFKQLAEKTPVLKANTTQKNLLSKQSQKKIIRPNVTVKNNLMGKTLEKFEMKNITKESPSPSKPNTAKVLKRLIKPTQPRISRGQQPPFILFEQGDLQLRFPKIEMKLLVLKILNQKIHRFT